MDSLFVVDECYESFSSAYEDFRKLLPLVPGSEPHCELLRVSFEGQKGMHWVQEAPFPPMNFGWHYRVEPHDKEAIERLLRQLEHLDASQFRARLKNSPLGRPGDVELELNPNEKPRIVIPFEDRVENTFRFFQKFSIGLSSAFRTQESIWDEIWKKFNLHANEGLEVEDPFHVEIPSWLGLSKKDTGMRWIPRKGKVGRHEVFGEMHLEFEDNDLEMLVRVYSFLNQKKRDTRYPLYLQFFSKAGKSPDLFLSERDLYELTISHEYLDHDTATSYLDALTKNPYASSVKDCFIVFDQKHATIERDCIATFTLRKTRMQGFEIRMNTTWEESVDPDAAFSPIEEESGLSWSRML